MAGAGGCAHPDELLDRLTDEQWAEWQLYARHFSTPMRRADLNSALERQATLIPHCQRGRVPRVEDLLPKYGTAATPRKKPAELFQIADAAFGAVAINQRAKPALPGAIATPVKVKRKT